MRSEDEAMLGRYPLYAAAPRTLGAPLALAPSPRHAATVAADKNEDDGSRLLFGKWQFIRTLQDDITQDLKDFMRQAGEVTYADAHKQHRNEGYVAGYHLPRIRVRACLEHRSLLRSRHHAPSDLLSTRVVEFATHSDMRAAIEKLDGTELNGRRIRLVEDRRSSRRRTRSSSSRSRSRSRDRRRSRSRSRSRRSSRSRSRSKSRPKSKSPAAKSRSQSRSKERSASRGSRRSDRGSAARESERRSQSRSHSHSRSRSRSRDNVKSPKERSRSKEQASPKRDEERRTSKSASRSRSRSRSRSGSRDHSRSRSRDHDRDNSVSPRQNGDAQDRASNENSPRSGD
ncbi:hypothetical protein EVAR_88355_1 [Eumeta japonica]|uniref:RRM domain-containing protein n=1 Tax=Eumeta variegata TaxID=151549 RepID=A0A4C1XE79_EUMVA|nr:hypothetical protein EVAR_88355_1 [Eumeta japonica]